MMEWLSDLATHPEGFAEYQQRYCCSGVSTWREGRGDPRTSAAVAGLAIGERAVRLVESLTSFSIVRRVAPPPPLRLGPIVFELPDPKQPDLGALVRQGVSVRDTMTGLERVVAETGAALGLDAATAAQLAALHEIEARLAADDARPYLVIAELFEQVRALLGSDGYQRYQAILDQYFEALILRRQAS